MRILFLVTLMICTVFSLCAGSIPGDNEKDLPGVRFVHKSFEDTLVKAQKENKLVMLDAYTDT